jgi:Ca2+-binding RTX toxin-like protein
MTLTATDPSPADQAAGFTFDIDWDGDDVVDQTVFGPSGTQVTHQYGAVGANTIKVTAKDQYDALSGVVTHAINIVRVEMQGADLVWGGTTGKDAVEFEETAAQTVEVRATLLDGVVVSDTQTFVGVTGRVIAFGGDDDDIIDAGGVDGLTNISATLIGGRGHDTIYGGDAADTIRGDAEGDGSEGRDVIYGGGGDDLIYGDGMEGAADTIMGGDGNDTIYGDNGDISADGAEGNDTIYGNDGDDMLFGGRRNDTIFGGDGNDIIDGEAGNDILSGGTGNDSLTGGTGRDLLFAGAGADTLRGNGGDDLLVAGPTSFDSSEADLKRIGNEWRSSGSYATRVANIGGTPGGLNDPIFLQPGITVFDDGEVDTLFGEGETDWFLYSQTGLNPDILSDLEAGEVETDIGP